jgi:hypothetical protein
VMAPMVSTTAEAAAFAEQVRGHGLSSGGVMVEVPAAAIRAGTWPRPATSCRSGPTTCPSTPTRPTGWPGSWPTCSTPGSRPCSTWSG